MRLYLLLLFTVCILNIILPYNITASDNEYYIKLLQYGTDSDISNAFSRVQRDLGDTVNKKVLDVFQEKHSHKVYLNVVHYIGLVKIMEAKNILIKELDREGQNDDYREEVIYALGKLKDRNSLQPLITIYDNRGTSKRIKIAIIDTCGEIGDLSIEDKLINIVESDYEDTDIRARAILALGKIESKKSLGLLEDILLNIYETKVLRMYAAYALSKVGRESILETLEEVIFDKSHEVAEYACKGIAEMESEKGGEILIEALRSDYDKVRYYAVIGLSRLKYKRAFDILKFKAEYDSNALVREESKKALEAIQIPMND